MRIQVKEALSVIENKYNLPKYIIELARDCLDNTDFTYEGRRYKQVEEAPVGSPLSPALANLLMEDFESRALQTSSHKPRLLLRYVDDTFVTWQYAEENLENFLNHTNSIHPKIKFITETEQIRKLPFLDILLKRK